MSRPAVDVPTVLVVEDDKPTRDLYTHALAAGGFRVVAVGDGLEALRRLEEGRLPDAVVLDLMLPRVGGLDVYNELRARRQTRHLPIVIVTGTDARDLEPAAFRFFLRKPVHPVSLVSTVENAVKRSRERN